MAVLSSGFFNLAPMDVRPLGRGVRWGRAIPMEIDNFREARHKFHTPWAKINASQITALLVKIPSGTVWYRGGQDPVEKQIPS